MDGMVSGSGAGGGGGGGAGAAGASVVIAGNKPASGGGSYNPGKRGGIRGLRIFFAGAGSCGSFKRSLPSTFLFLRLLESCNINDKDSLTMATSFSLFKTSARGIEDAGSLLEAFLCFSRTVFSLITASCGLVGRVASGRDAVRMKRGGRTASKGSSLGTWERLKIVREEGSSVSKAGSIKDDMRGSMTHHGF